MVGCGKYGYKGRPFVYYKYDSVTGLCFAARTDALNTLTCVPCNEAVMRLINDSE